MKEREKTAALGPGLLVLVLCLVGRTDGQTGQDRGMLSGWMVSE